MDYLAKKFKDKVTEKIVSFFSTDDNIVCEDGRTLRENLADKGGGDAFETVAPKLFAKGVLPANEAVNKVDTGVTLADLAEYKTFYVCLKGASNNEIANMYVVFGDNLYSYLIRKSTASFVIVCEFVDVEHNYIRIRQAHSGNPSVYPISFTNLGVSNNNGSMENSQGVLGASSLLSDVSDNKGKNLKWYCANTPTIDYEWAIIGMTK